MGRKAILKDRKAITPKVNAWVRDLVPLLQTRSLEKLTLDELAALMGKSKSTIYAYFTTKEQIVHLAITTIIEDMQINFEENQFASKSMEEAYKSLFGQICTGIEGLTVHFLEEIKIYYPNVWKEVEVFTHNLLQLFEGIYRQGMKLGEFRGFNIALLMAMDDHFVMSIMTDTDKFEHQGLSLQELVSDYLDLRLSALKQ